MRTEEPPVVEAVDDPADAEPEHADRFLAAHFLRSRWHLVVASALTSPVAVVATWPLSDHGSMLWFLAVHQLAVLAMALTFALPSSEDRPPGLSKVAIAGIGLAQIALSSAMFFEPEAARTADFAFGVGIVLYAFAAGLVAALGPYRAVARLSLVCLFTPYTIAGFAFGHPGMAIATMLFVAIIGGLAVEKTSMLFDELMTLRREAADRATEAEAIATTDALTGLTNRYGLELLDGELLQKEIFGIFIDLDKFKAVNDTLGHKAGDEVLVEVASRLRRYVRPSDTVVRLGGDEFFILFWSDHEIPVMKIADRIRTAVDRPIEVEGGMAEVSASMGVSRQSPGVLNLDALIQNADEALYMAKSLGRNQVFASSLRLNMNAGEDGSERSNGTLH